MNKPSVDCMKKKLVLDYPQHFDHMHRKILGWQNQIIDNTRCHGVRHDNLGSVEPMKSETVPLRLHVKVLIFIFVE